LKKENHHGSLLATKVVSTAACGFSVLLALGSGLTRLSCGNPLLRLKAIPSGSQSTQCPAESICKTKQKCVDGVPHVGGSG
jgi:hypothetical protein